jgi:orotidine-5'-phosphate decarboxylase
VEEFHAMTFTERLRSVQQKQHSLLCIGLDGDPRLIPRHLHGSVVAFHRAIIEATCDLVCAYKLNLAFYEALGLEGWKALVKTREAVPSFLITIGDGKRGDIGNTSERSVRALFGELEFDAVTVNPYMGYDSIEPFLRYPERGAFILALTSNKGSNDFQRLKVRGVPLAEHVVRKAKRWNTNNNVGLVVGATHPRELRRFRSLAPTIPILLPGIGAQGGDLRLSVRYGCTQNGDLAILTVSRAVLYASGNKDFAEAARQYTTTLHRQIEKAREMVKATHTV